MDLLLEEMCRVIMTEMKISEEWIGRAKTVEEKEPQLPGDISRGVKTHAYRQANTWSSLVSGCVTVWAPYLNKHGLSVDWYPSARPYVDAVLERSRSGEQAREGEPDEAALAPDRTLQAMPALEDEDEDDNAGEDKEPSDEESDGLDAMAHVTSDEGEDSENERGGP